MSEAPQKTEAERVTAEEKPEPKAEPKDGRAEEAPEPKAEPEDGRAEEAPAEEVPAEEVPAEEAQAEEVPVEDKPAAEPPEETPAEEAEEPAKEKAAKEKAAEAETESKSSPPAESKAKKPAKVKAPAPLAVRIVFGLCGLVLLAGFFFPWVTYGDIANTRGFELAFDTNLPPLQQGIVAACPAIAVALTVAGILGFRGTIWLGIVTSGAVLLAALATIAYQLFKIIDVGLWMVLLSALVALVAGVAALLTGRRRRA